MTAGFTADAGPHVSSTSSPAAVAGEGGSGRGGAGDALAATVVGLAAYSCTVSAVRYAKDADKSPSVATRSRVLEMSARRVHSYQSLVQVAATWGIDAPAAASSYLGLVDGPEERLRPADFSERILKSYLSLGVLSDFLLALVRELPEDLGTAVTGILVDDAYAPFALEVLQAGLSGDAQLAARLGLWGRRVVGESMGLMMNVLDQVPGLAALHADESKRSAIHDVVSQGAVRRMEGLGLRV